MVSLILWFFLALPVSASATTYYVATTGSDSNNGTDESTPFLTVAKAVTTMVAGDTTYVKNGTYTETSIRFSRTGTQASPIKLLNYPGHAPKISFSNPASSSNRILIQHASGANVAMGWITIEGFEITNGYEGMKWHSLHNSTIRRNWIHHNLGQGILGIGGHDVLIERNNFVHNGDFAGCAAESWRCNQTHGLYAHGKRYLVLNNIFSDNLGYAIQHNGSSTSSFSASLHPSSDFAGAQEWVISDNTFAYQHWRGAIVEWGGQVANTRIENNIFYENCLEQSNFPQGIEWLSMSSGGNLGITVRNNHAYASGSGGTQFIGTSGATEGVQYTQSGNVVNVSAPAFVNGGSNSLPASPDYRLTASAPVNIARVNEFTNNATLVVGAYKTVGTPGATITANKITLTFPMSTAVPIQNLTTTGVSIGCTGANCPGSPTVGSVARIVNTDSQVEVVVNGITSNACVSTDQNWTVSYSSSTGSWTGNDHIGVYPGSHQKIFSVTSLAVTNQCDGTGPPTEPGGPYIHYNFNEGTGTTATNDGSAGAGANGTLTNGPTWGTGKTGYGVTLTGNNTEHVAIPYGNGINPSTQSLTIAFGVNIPAGNESLSRAYAGASLGVDQRLYVSTLAGTWRLGIQASNDGTAGNIAVTSGWHHVCITMDSGVDVATLYIDGVASTAAGAVKSYTSYILAGDFDLGRIADLSTGGGGGTYDDFFIYTSVEDCAALAEAFNATAPPATGTLAQAAIQFQSVILDTAGNPIVVGPSVQSIEVQAGGGVVILFQAHCQNISDCALTAFKLVYSKNGSATFQQVPDVETADGIWMWGATTEANLNNGTRSTRLTGSCVVTTGATQVTSAQTPSVDLPQDGCTVLAYIIRVGATHAGDYYDLKLRTEANLDFTGGYAQTARVRVVNPMASGIGF